MTTPAGRRIALLAVAASLTLSLAACSGDGDKGAGEDGPTPSSGSSATGSSAAVTPGAQPTAYPVPAEAHAEQLPSLGTRTGLGYTVTLNSVQRVSDSMGLVTATLVSSESTVGDAFTEPGYTLTKNPDTGKLDPNYDFSGVTVTVKGDPTVYEVMRDDQQACACTKGLITVKRDVPFAAYAYVTLPAGATTVDVTVRGLAPFTGVRVAS